MRSATLVLFTLAATMFFTIGATGQQDEVFVQLPDEPEAAAVIAPTLFGAASSNDFATFDSLYRSEPQPQYAELHRLWSWSMEHPVGAFYGAEEHARLSAMYPGFEVYIADHSIVDSRGNVFYPTVETRQYLLGRAAAGVLARSVPAPRKSAPAVARVEPPAAVTPAAVAVAVSAAIVAEPPAAALPPVVAAPAPVVTPAPQLTAPVIVTEAAILTPFVPRNIAAAPARESVRGAIGRNEARRGDLSRSIFLMIAGLLGVGMLSVMLHAPHDEGPRPTH